MVFSARVFALTGSLALVVSGVATSAHAASPTTFPLRGTKMASMAHGIAQVTQLGAGDYKVVITISAMPVASTLHTTPIRHAYVAWAFNASMMHAPTKPTSGTHTSGKPPTNPAARLGKLTPIALHATTAGTYTGTGTVMMTQTPGIIVTAEVSAMVHTPAMPFWVVLVGNPMQRT